MEDHTLEEAQEEKKNPKRQRQLFLAACIGSVVIAIGIFLLLINGYLNKQYNNYTVMESYQRKDSNTVQYISVGGNLVKYSKDGISQLNSSGEAVWSGSYNMDNPQVSSCGDYILVADVGGKEAFVYQEEDTGVKISVDYEILQASVSRQGIVALLLEDTSSNMINLYNPYDVSSELLAEIPTNVEDGYPISMALSPDGVSVVATYLCVANGESESRVAFYNFSEVGQSKDYLVGAQNYKDELIADILFLDDSRVCLLGDAGYYIWSNMKKPVQTQQKKSKQEIRSVFYNKEYFGMITETEENKQPYRMSVYNMENGKRTLNMKFDNSYDNVELVDKEIIMHSNREISIFKLNGVERFRYKTEENVDYFFKTKKRNQYYLLYDSTTERIKLST